MSWYVAVLKKYAVFSGRARRKEFWAFYLVNLAISVVLGIVAVIVGARGATYVSVIAGLYALAMLLPGLAVTVRRLHDIGCTGWWWLISLLPLGSLVLLIFYFLDSQPGDNRYGPNPKGMSATDSKPAVDSARPILVVYTALLGLAIFNLQGRLNMSFPAVLSDFGWSRAVVTGATFIASLASLLFLLAAGVVFDRRGGRLLVISGAIVTALAGVAVTKVNSPPLFAASYSIYSAGGALFAGVVPVLLMGNWFVRLRGIFTGVVVALASVATMMGGLLTGTLLDHLGWRLAYLGFGLLPLILIPLAVAIRRRPEDIGSTPDFGMVGDRGTLLGRWSPLAAARHPASTDARSPNSMWPALGTVAGVLFMVIAFIAYASTRGVEAYLFPRMIMSGADRTAAGSLFLAMQIAVPVGALVLGVLSDFVHTRFCLAASLLTLGAGILVSNTDRPSTMGLVLIGFGQGGLICLTTVALADYFGRGALGRLRGFVGMLTGVAGVIGPLVAGYIFDAIAGLGPIIFGMGIAVLACAVLALFMWPPQQGHSLWHSQLSGN